MDRNYIAEKVAAMGLLINELNPTYEMYSNFIKGIVDDIEKIKPKMSLKDAVQDILKQIESQGVKTFIKPVSNIDEANDKLTTLNHQLWAEIIQKNIMKETIRRQNRMLGIAEEKFNVATETLSKEFEMEENNEN